MRRKMSLIVVLFCLPAYWLPALAQQSKADSLQRMRGYMMLQAALRYPVLRMAAVQFETVGKVHYDSKLYGKDFLAGHIQPASLVKVALRLPVYNAGGQDISVGVAYVSQATVLKNTVNKMPETTINDGTYNLQNLGVALNYRRTDSLFNKPILWGATAFGNFSLQSPVSRVTGLVFGIVPLRTTRSTRISAGLAVVYDPASVIPVIPTFSYWHKFAHSPWEISFDVPTHLYVRRSVFTKGLLSIGTELAENKLLRKVDLPALQGGFAFRDLDLKNGFVLEYPLAKKVLIGCGGGLLYTTQYRLQDPGKSNNDYAVRINRNPAPYFNINISLLR